MNNMNNNITNTNNNNNKKLYNKNNNKNNKNNNKKLYKNNNYNNNLIKNNGIFYFKILILLELKLMCTQMIQFIILFHLDKYSSISCLIQFVFHKFYYSIASNIKNQLQFPFSSFSNTTPNNNINNNKNDHQFKYTKTIINCLQVIHDQLWLRFSRRRFKVKCKLRIQQWYHMNFKTFQHFNF
jgi:hypothetical protein